MSSALRTALLIVLYPVLFVGTQFGLASRFTTLAASLVGLAVFVVLFVQLPTTFDVLDLGPRIARPFVAYAGGLVAAGAIVLIGRPKPG